MGLLSWDRLEQGLFHRKRWVRLLTIFGFCLAAGLPVGAIIGLVGGLYGSALLLALAIGYGMLRSTLLGLVTLVGVVCLLPFAALPINIGFSPTILDLVLFAIFFTWISRIVTHKEGEFIAPTPTLPFLVFVALAVVSFILGLSYSRLTSNVVRHFGEILLSVLLFLLVTNLLRTLSDLQDHRVGSHPGRLCGGSNRYCALCAARYDCHSPSLHTPRSSLSHGFLCAALCRRRPYVTAARHFHVHRSQCAGRHAHLCHRR